MIEPEYVKGLEAWMAYGKEQRIRAQVAEELARRLAVALEDSGCGHCRGLGNSDIEAALAAAKEAGLI